MGQPAGARPGWYHGDLARAAMRDMGVAALISWLVTAFVGLYLLAVWLIENDDSDQGATRSRLHGSVIAAHVLLAFTTFTLVLLTVLGVGGS
jgi:uncharacterized membrane protein YozB (DUF420 family)